MKQKSGLRSVSPLPTLAEGAATLSEEGVFGVHCSPIMVTAVWFVARDFHLGSSTECNLLGSTPRKVALETGYLATAAD
jgi:hypothetical protein